MEEEEGRRGKQRGRDQGERDRWTVRHWRSQERRWVGLSDCSNFHDFFRFVCHLPTMALFILETM